MNVQSNTTNPQYILVQIIILNSKLWLPQPTTHTVWEWSHIYVKNFMKLNQQRDWSNSPHVTNYQTAQKMLSCMFIYLFLVLAMLLSITHIIQCGYAVAQLVEALRYKLQGAEFDSQCGHSDFLSTYSFWPHHGCGADSASKRNEDQGYLQVDKGSTCVGLTTLPHLCSNCLEILSPEPPGALWACPGLYRDCLYFTQYQIVGRLETKNMVVILAQFKVLFWYLYGGNKESHDKLVRIANHQAEIWTQSLPITKQQCYPAANIWFWG